MKFFRFSYAIPMMVALIGVSTGCTSEEAVKSALNNHSSRLMMSSLSSAEKVVEEKYFRKNSSEYRKIICCLLLKTNETMIVVNTDYISIYCAKINNTSTQNVMMTSTISTQGMSTLNQNNTTTEAVTTGNFTVSMSENVTMATQTPNSSETSTTLTATTAGETMTTTTNNPTTTNEPTTSTTNGPTTTNQPTTANEPTTNQPPTTNEPTTNQPLTTNEPTTNQPPTTNEPTTNQPPTTNEPTTNQPPTTNEPTTNQPPTTNEQTANQTATTNQSTTNGDNMTTTNNSTPSELHTTTSSVPSTTETTSTIVGGSGMAGKHVTYDAFEGVSITLNQDMNTEYNSWSCSQNNSCSPVYLSAISVNSALFVPHNNHRFVTNIVYATVTEVADMNNPNDLIGYEKNLTINFYKTYQLDRKCFESSSETMYSMSSCTSVLMTNMTKCSCMGDNYQAVMVFDNSTTPQPSTTTTMETSTSTTMSTTPISTKAGQGQEYLELQLNATYEKARGNLSHEEFFNLLQDQINKQMKMNDDNIEAVYLQNVNKNNFEVSLAVIFKDKDNANATINNIGAAVKGDNFKIMINGTSVKANNDFFKSKGEALSVLPTKPPVETEEDDDDDYIIVVAVVVSILGVAFIIIAVVVYVTISKKSRIRK